MSVLVHKPRRSRTFRLECLESRKLLSTIPVLADHTVEVSSMAKVRETITGSMGGPLHFAQTTAKVGTASFRATGSLTILGQASLAGSDNYSASRRNGFKVKYSNGSITLSDSSGDTITGSFKGSGSTSGTGLATFKVKGPVTGGTGLYSGAAGKVSASGSFIFAVDTFTITLTVRLTRT
jgi:hypothetical protein